MKLSKLYDNNRLLILLISILVILIGLPIILFIMLKRNASVVAWFDNSWEYRQPITVSNNTGGTLTNEDVLINIDTATLIGDSKLQADCDDLRFIDSDDSSSLTYWIEGGCNTSTTQVWVQIPSLPSVGKTIYMYYGNDSATNSEDSWAGNFVKLSTSSCTGNWSRVGAYDGYFIRGNSSYGSAGGSSTHTHSVSGSTSTASAGGSYYDGAVSVTQYNHSHGVTEGCTTDDHTPPYLDMIFCRAAKLDLTSNDVLLFDVSSESGWTQFSTLDNRFPRGSASYGTTGGSETHTHTISLSLGSAGSGSAVTCTSGCSNVSAASHTHSVSNPSTSGTNLPPYLDMVYMQKDSSGSLTNENAIVILNTTSMPLGWERFTDLDTNFPRGAATYGATGGSLSHTHSGSVTSGGVSATRGTISGGGRTLVGSHTHTVSWSAASSSHLPPYYDVIFAQRKTSQATSLGTEESQTPTAPTIQTATATSTSSITWNFTDNSDNETGFKIYDTGNNLMVTCATPNISSCLEGSLSENTQYTRKVTAYNAYGESDYSSATSRFTNTINPSIATYSSTSNTITITSTNISNPTSGSSGYYFDCTGSSCDSGINSWIQANTDTADTLDYNTGYTFQVKSRNGDGIETTYSATQEVWTEAITPTLSTNTITDTTIELEATGINNITSGASGVYFECMNGACSTGIDEWITSSTDIATALTPNTQYSFSVMARNYDGVETASSISSNVYTLATQPAISEITDVDTDSMVVEINPYSNPSNTTYLLEEVNTSKYVDASGELVVGEQWLTYAQLGSTNGIEVGSLTSNTEYTFRVKARNAENTETSFSSPVSEYTNLEAPESISVNSKDTNSITWEISTTQSGYEGLNIYDSSDTLIKTCAVPDTTTCMEDSLSPNTQYERKITIYSTNSESSPTSLLSTYTNADTVSISDISVLNDYEVEIELDLDSNPDVTNIEIYENGLGKFYDNTLGILVESEIEFDPESNTITVSGLEPNTLYSFKTRAISFESIPTSWSSDEGVRTYAQVPQIVTSSAISTTSGNITVDMGDNPEGTRISVLETSTSKYLNSASNTLQEIEDVFDPLTDTFNISSLSENTKYTFKVRGYNEDDIYSEWSSTYDLVTNISAPTPQIVTVASNSVVVGIEDLPNMISGSSAWMVSRLNTWSKDSTQTVTGLTPNTSYTFTVKARNQNGIETSNVSTSEIVTLANIPRVSSTTKVSSTSARVYLNLNSNPTNTQLAIQDSITGMYVNANGQLQQNVVWQTYAQWGGANGKLISGIEDVRQLGFRVKARNSSNIETNFSEAQYVGTGSVISNIPSDIDVLLEEDEGVDLTSQPQLGTKDVKIKQGEYLVANFDVSFEEDRDWEDIVISSDPVSRKTVIKVSDQHGVSLPFTMYVVMGESNAFRICPLATSLEDVTTDCMEGVLTKDSFPQEVDIDGNIVTISQAKIDGVYYWIADGLTGTGGMGVIEDGEDEIIADDVEDEDSNENESTFPTVVSNIARRSVEFATRAIKGTSEVLDNTIVGTLNEQELSDVVATTTTVTITVGVATTGISQTFFLIMHGINGVLNALGFRRKKIPFGYVYDSQTKDPITNAVVRIFKGKELVETTVTDSNGVFLSKLDIGEYLIEVRKGGYIFPSDIIRTKEDYPFTNVYIGGVFKKVRSSDITVNIPLDSKELSGCNKLVGIMRSLFSWVLAIFNVGLFAFGVLLLIYTYYKFPDRFSWIMVLLYIPALYFLSQSIFRKVVRYGRVLDKEGKPVTNTEVLLLEKEFNEVVDKRVTDSRGRYRFVCKKGIFDIMVGKEVLVENLKVRKNGYIYIKKLKLK